MIKTFQFIRENDYKLFESRLTEAVKIADKSGLDVEIQYQATSIVSTVIYSAVVVGKERIDINGRMSKL